MLQRFDTIAAGGILEMANHRLYPFWGHLTEALRTGLPERSEERRRRNLRNALPDPARLEQFL